ncbi:MAG: hypothetical protein RLY97_2217 [Pseudomonadota bacterium]
MRSLLLACSSLALTLGAATPLYAQSAEAPPAPPLGKLTNAVTPSAYRLDMTVDPSKPRFSGHVDIDANLNASSRFITIHGRDLAMKSASATVAGKTYPATYSEVESTGVALLTFAEALPAGPVTFGFDYDAPFQDGPAGMFRVKVGDDYYSWTQFESTDARAAFPSFDQPGYKQPFTITLRTPTGLKAISNSPETGVTVEGGMDVHRFAPTLPLPTYLAAMMVGPFVTAESVVPPTPQRATPLPLRIVSTKQNAAKLNFALENSKSIVTHLEDYFGQSFPYPKLDQITSPVMPGAMENAGADLYQDNLLVLDDNASTRQKRSFGMVVSHELAHQWFGDLVTPAWWDDIWLNESFANWMGFRIGHAWRNDLNIASGALGEGFGAMGTDALLAGRPIHQKIDRNSQIDAAFDNITYGKGGHVIAMVAGFMGDSKFRDGVRSYMAAHRYGNATSGDFFGAMADVSGDPRLLPAMQSFTDQQGVPLLTFTGGNGKYTVTQSRYARLGTTPPATKWGVPMCARSGSERICHLIDGPSAQISFKTNAAVLPNAGGTGYYRFELPKAEWDRLIASSATLSGGEALALADSLRASFQAGRASAGQLATLARTMKTNPDSYASDAAMDGLDALNGWGFLNDPAAAAYRKFVGKLFAPDLEKLGFDPRAKAYSTDSAERSQRRVQVVARMAGTAKNTDVRGKLASAVAAWLGGDSAALDPSWYGEALAIHLETTGIDGAKSLLDRALSSQDPLFRPAALRAIAASGKANIATWVLDGITDKRLRISEKLQMVAVVIGSPATRDMGYDWMHAHLDQLLSGGAGIFFASKAPQVLSGFCSVERADQIDKDFGAKFVGKTGQLELERSVERVRSCGNLKKARAAEASAEIAKLK